MPKKKFADRACPHGVVRYTGMEICVTCDMSICPECGDEYNQRDMSGADVCYPCCMVRKLRKTLDEVLAWQAKRKAAHGMTTKEPSKITEEELIEQLADKEHTSWSRWMEYLFSKCQPDERGGFYILPSDAEHWQKEIETPYANLPEHIKQSDRDEVVYILPIIRQYTAK